MTQRDPRQHIPKYLKWLRTQPCCCGCGKPAPSDAAHLRSGVTGIGTKPHDWRAVPLNRSCHMRQHAHGNEAEWWFLHDIKAPLLLADSYYTQFRRENPDAPPPFIKKLPPIKPRKPREQRQKIKGRSSFR